MIQYMRVVKEVRTETAHRLINYEGRCAHLHGHSWKWKVSIKVPKPLMFIPDESSGMLVDFSWLKELAYLVLDPLDHALLLHKDDPLVVQAFGNLHIDQLTEFTCPSSNNPSFLDGTNGQDGRLYVFPFNPTSENLALWAQKQLKKKIFTGTFGVRDKGNLWTEENISQCMLCVECHETASSACIID